MTSSEDAPPAGLPERSTSLTRRVTVSGWTYSAKGVETLTPDAVATMRPVTSPYWARSIRADGSRVSGTFTVAPAGTVTDRAPRRASEERMREPSLPVTDRTSRLSRTGLSPELVYGTWTVVRSLPSWGQLKVPPWTAGAPVTVVEIAALASSRPPPVSRTSPGTAVVAEETSAALICWAVQSGWRCLTRAAAPATWGVAIDVPDIAW